MHTKIELCTHEKQKLISKKRMSKEFGPQRIRHDQTCPRDRQVGKVFILPKSLQKFTKLPVPRLRWDEILSLSWTWNFKLSITEF